MKIKILEVAVKIGIKNIIKTRLQFPKLGLDCLDSDIQCSKLEFHNYIQPNFEADLRNVKWACIYSEDQSALEVKGSKM